LFFEGDVRKSESVEAGVNHAFDKYGTVDFLIHSAIFSFGFSLQ
ncbi:unnamed protein product, partial [marine sediment metagenome]